MACTVNAIIRQLTEWVGYSESNGKHKQIIDIYNNCKPLPRGYKMKYTDSWCAATITARAIKCGATDIIGRECSCEQFIKIFKNKGIWIEDGTITPKVGDIILYNWGATKQPNDGAADHIGLVVRVNGKNITAIEGNKNNSVSYRGIVAGHVNIRGYARPKYKAEGSYDVDKVARDVIAGKYGNGEDRKKKLTAAGYDYNTVQKRVNELLK